MELRADDHCDDDHCDDDHCDDDALDPRGPYLTTITELLIVIRQKGFSLTATEQKRVDDWRRQGIALDALCRAVLRATDRPAEELPARLTLDYLAPAVEEHLRTEATTLFGSDGSGAAADAVSVDGELCHAIEAALRGLGAFVLTDEAGRFADRLKPAVALLEQALDLARRGELDWPGAIVLLAESDDSRARACWSAMTETERVALRTHLERMDRPAEGPSARVRRRRLTASQWVETELGVPRVALGRRKS